MPPYTKRSLDGSPLLFDQLIQSLQQSATNVPFVTVIHAYTNGMTVSLGEVPDSPSATPNNLTGSSFLDCNTVFTHAALVPDYGNLSTSLAETASNPNVTDL